MPDRAGREQGTCGAPGHSVVLMLLCDVDVVVQVVDQLQEELSGCQTELAESRERVEHLATVWC